MIQWVWSRAKYPTRCWLCGQPIKPGTWSWLALTNLGTRRAGRFCRDCERHRLASEKELLKGAP